LYSTTKRQMQTQQRMPQRTPLSNHETRNETNVSSAYSWNWTKRLIRLSCKSKGREFHAAGAEKPKLRFPNIFVRTRGISSWPDVEDRRKASEGRTETGFMYEESYLGAKECRQRKKTQNYCPIHYHHHRYVSNMSSQWPWVTSLWLIVTVMAYYWQTYQLLKLVLKDCTHILSSVDGEVIPLWLDVLPSFGSKMFNIKFFVHMTHTMIELGALTRNNHWSTTLCAGGP